MFPFTVRRFATPSVSRSLYGSFRSSLIRSLNNTARKFPSPSPSSSAFSSSAAIAVFPLIGFTKRSLSSQSFNNNSNNTTTTTTTNNNNTDTSNNNDNGFSSSLKAALVSGDLSSTQPTLVAAIADAQGKLSTISIDNTDKINEYLNIIAASTFRLIQLFHQEIHQQAAIGQRSSASLISVERLLNDYINIQFDILRKFSKSSSPSSPLSTSQLLLLDNLLQSFSYSLSSLRSLSRILEPSSLLSQLSQLKRLFLSLFVEFIPSPHYRNDVRIIGLFGTFSRFFMELNKQSEAESLIKEWLMDEKNNDWPTKKQGPFDLNYYRRANALNHLAIINYSLHSHNHSHDHDHHHHKPGEVCNHDHSKDNDCKNDKNLLLAEKYLKQALEECKTFIDAVNNNTLNLNEVKADLIGPLLPIVAESLPILYGRLISLIHNNYSVVLFHLNRPKEGSDMIHSSVELLSKLLPPYNSDLIAAITSSYILLVESGQEKKAEEVLQPFLKLTEEQIKLLNFDAGDSIEELIQVQHQIGTAESLTNAIRLLDIAIQLRLANQARTEGGDMVLAELQQQKAACLIQTGQYESSLPLLDSSIKIRHAMGGIDEGLAMTYHDLSVANRKLNKIDDAEKAINESIKIWEQIDNEINNNNNGEKDEEKNSGRTEMGKRSLKYAVCLNERAELHYLQKKPDLAIPYIIEAIDIQKYFYGNDSPKVTATMGSLATMYFTTGHWSETIRTVNEMIANYKKNEGEDSMNGLMVLPMLSQALAFIGKQEESIDAYRKCVEGCRGKPETEKYFKPLVERYIDILKKAGKNAEADEAQKKYLSK